MNSTAQRIVFLGVSAALGVAAYYVAPQAGVPAVPAAIVVLLCLSLTGWIALRHRSRAEDSPAAPNVAADLKGQIQHDEQAAIDDRSSLFEDLPEYRDDQQPTGYQPSFRSVMVALGDIKPPETAPAQASTPTENAEKSSAGFDQLMSAMSPEQPRAAQASESESPTESTGSGTGFDDLFAGLGRGGQEPSPSRAGSNSGVGFGELISSMGSSSNQAGTSPEQTSAVEPSINKTQPNPFLSFSTEDRPIHRGAQISPFGAFSGGAEPSEQPGKFEVVGDDTLSSQDLDALSELLNDPSEPDPLAAPEPAAIEVESEAGLAEHTSPNQLRNSLLAARMRRNASDDPGSPSRPPRRRQVGGNGADDTRLSPPMGILRRAGEDTWATNSGESEDLTVPEPGSTGKVMTVRIDQHSQDDLISRTESKN